MGTSTVARPMTRFSPALSCRAISYFHLFSSGILDSTLRPPGSLWSLSPSKPEGSSPKLTRLLTSPGGPDGAQQAIKTCFEELGSACVYVEGIFFYLWFIPIPNG
ncbi:unnamed protein product [Nezara viridula]|uniref:Uncharacterized protein n=1 Tax=Nezara viridula TaxID=85310 RepID=A0A9P0HJ14_NEZVI|nr:unnamed protein product [Nezara viridula]